MAVTLSFAPLLPWAAITALGLASAGFVGFALWRGLPGWWLRALGLGLLVLSLAGPQLREEAREGLPSVAYLVVDRSESTTLEDRAGQIEDAAEALAESIRALSSPDAPLELEIVETGQDPEGRDAGTRLLTALDEAAARTPPEQIAGAILLSDGQVHDAERLEGFPAPVHGLIAGERDAFDVALDLVTAPGFGIVGGQVSFGLRVRVLGAAPGEIGPRVPALVAIDGGAPRPVLLSLGSETLVPVPIEHAGPTVVDIRIPEREGELTARNNRVIAEVNGVRDRLRVLLVSGEPHPGGRTWRDLLKSDPAVDLIHFTILRPPAKQDGTPVSELSLIAFPTRELFLEKIDGFDLIIFDRYRYRRVLLPAYLARIGTYVREGGAVLLASGPAFAGADSLARTPLAAILPALPSLEVIERPFRPQITDLGARHPVTAGLAEAAGIGPDGPQWGSWMRQITVEPRSGSIVMSGIEDRPLLILDRVGKGRVALLASDHAWLWTRGHEGGGPQADLLRRTAHWLMREPELEEEAMFTRVEGRRVVIERRTLAERPPEELLATPPDGAAEPETRALAYAPAGPGRWRAVLDGAEEGLWRFSDGERMAVAAVGPPAPMEYRNPIASETPVEPLVDATGGRIAWLSDGLPDLRSVAEGRRAHGRGWFGLERRDAYRVTGIELTPLLPAWAAALATGLLFLAAWRREGR
ncbi:membrane protein [Paralimibaculum aggregatum]|uniref:Membrane protein n=1 Tax=Paralimibaculum aggregatum TaxID=3036245 RepID=A0ABQ6LR94_9RHOB|nr:glutamine amidotransferase [Limibaculum sp. NKW23]GMG83789.1 membrane protein [Limibaculum sp. NKW23]